MARPAGKAHARALALVLYTLAPLSLAAPALASPEERPITQRDPSAIDIAKTPVTDLNIANEAIPEVLVRAIDRPYELDNLRSCRALGLAVNELDTILGPDLDIPQKERDRISAGRVAKWVVASFIPFRGLIREISGASEHERKVRAAIQAGMARRGFLKGVGLARHCTYPAAPATDADIARIQNELDRRDEAANANGGPAQGSAQPEQEPSPTPGPPESLFRTEHGIPYVSQPVVQPTD